MRERRATPGTTAVPDHVQTPRPRWVCCECLAGRKWSCGGLVQPGGSLDASLCMLPHRSTRPDLPGAAPEPVVHAAQSSARNCNNHPAFRTVYCAQLGPPGSVHAGARALHTAYTAYTATLYSASGTYMHTAHMMVMLLLLLAAQDCDPARLRLRTGEPTTKHLRGEHRHLSGFPTQFM